MNNLPNTDAIHVAEKLHHATSLALAQPFDLARSLYAMAVRLGLIENSLLSSARFGRDISSLEKLTLGPWARQV
nr:hypothetical protein [uncultured Rhodoferax sp.]